MAGRRFPLVVITLIIAASAVPTALNFMRRSRAPLREPTADSVDGGVTFCRAASATRPAG
jgi:hypothetical protein